MLLAHPPGVAQAIVEASLCRDGALCHVGQSVARVLLASFSVLPSPDRQGVQLQHAISALASRHAVDVMVIRGFEQRVVDRALRARLLRVPVGQGPLGERVDSFRRALKRQLEGTEYDVIHVRDGFCGPVALDARKQTGAQLVVELALSAEAALDPSDGALGEALATNEKLCLEAADLVIVPTELARSTLEGRGLGDRVVVVRPGVDVDRFDWEPDPGASAPRVFYAGRVGPGRGLRLLVRSLGRVSVRPVELFLAGPIDVGYAEVLGEEAERAGLPRDALHVVGAVDPEDMPRAISTATVCVAPWAPDEVEWPLASFPTKILEYLACRRATIAPRRAAIAEVVRDDLHALLFEPGSEAELASCLETLLGDAATRARLADAGYAHVRSDYAASSARRALREAYARVAPAEPDVLTLASALPPTGLHRLETQSDHDDTRVEPGGG